jgi:ribose transport system permease protein
MSEPSEPEKPQGATAEAEAEPAEAGEVTERSGREITRATPRKSVRALSERFGLIGVWVVMVVVFSIARPHTYPTLANMQTIFGSQAVLLVVTLGLVVPLTTGDFDLSIASTLSLSAMVLALLQVNHGWALGPAIIVAMCAALAVGLVNGLLIVACGLDSFVITLGIATFLQGVIAWISNSATITGISSGLTTWTVTNTILGIPLVFWYGVVATLLLWFVLQHTPLGRRLLFVGRGRSVARLTGLAVGRLRFGALVASAVISGAAGVFYAGSLGSADPISGQSFLLPAFAAAFLGATTIVPGRFNALGTFAAVYFLVSGITGLQLLGANSFVQQLFYGGALVVAVGLARLARPKVGRT